MAEISKQDRGSSWKNLAVPACAVKHYEMVVGEIVSVLEATGDEEDLIMAWRSSISILEGK